VHHPRHDGGEQNQNDEQGGVTRTPGARHLDRINGLRGEPGTR
jgi:hypothetical protein